MTRYVACVALVLTLFYVGAIRAEDEATTVDSKEYYPTGWTQVDYRPIIDNERLFKKYKECIMSEKMTGCPRDVTIMKQYLPEVIETMCGKCLPVHVAKVKEIVEYICHKRRADYEEVRKWRDPTGELQAAFEEKFGKVNC